MDTTDPRMTSPACERNRGPLLDVLREVLPPQGLALEIACGTGQHAAHFAPALPGWQWQPTDPHPECLRSTAAWCAGLANVRPPLLLDVTAPGWPGAPQAVTAIFCANLIHIAPWAACQGLMREAAAHLAPDGQLLTYGPYFVDGEPPAPGNLAFDTDLKQRDPAWGVRRLAEVQAEAARHGLRLVGRFDMPANNLTLVWGR